MDTCIVILGNPGDGFTYWGPFEDPEQANEWAERHARGDEWWVIILEKPT